MKRPNITAGPWAAKNVNGTYVVRCPSGRTVSENPGVTHEDDANARLIAAAPDMAKALERLLACPDLAFDAMEPESLEAMAEARAALIKAGYEFP
jgi:hypothetical protein